VDEVIIFHQLGREHIKRVVDLQFDLLKKRLADRHIEIKLTEKAKELLVKEGYDPAYGARPLKRTIQRLVLDPLAVKVLKGEFKDGNTVVVDAKADDIIFTKKEITAPTG
jgi:ATP-dependent Clp protease ATP-binding subunit ClpA